MCITVNKLLEVPLKQSKYPKTSEENLSSWLFLESYISPSAPDSLDLMGAFLLIKINTCIRLIHPQLEADESEQEIL